MGQAGSRVRVSELFPGDACTQKTLCLGDIWDTEKNAKICISSAKIVVLCKIWQHHAVPAACYILITPGCSQWKKASGKEIITKMHIEKHFKSLLSIQNELKMQQMAISTLSLKKKEKIVERKILPLKYVTTGWCEWKQISRAPPAQPSPGHVGPCPVELSTSARMLRALEDTGILQDKSLEFRKWL